MSISIGEEKKERKKDARDLLLFFSVGVNRRIATRQNAIPKIPAGNAGTQKTSDGEAPMEILIDGWMGGWLRRTRRRANERTRKGLRATR